MMNNYKAGFSLISFLVYLSAMIFVVSAGFQWLLNMHSYYQIALKKQRRFLQTHFVNDAFIRDIHTAPKQTIAWEKQEDHEISWKTDNGYYIAWKYDNQTVTRTQKKWDKSNKMWGDTVTSVLMNAIDDVKWHLIHSDNGTIESVLVSYTQRSAILPPLFIRTGIHE